MSPFKVPFVDLKQRYKEEKNEILTCVDRVLSLGHLIMTPELSNFEEEICNYTGAKHCVGLNSGTDALMIGLMTAGVKKNDEVITSPISFVATSGAIAHIGAKPIYVDTGEDLNINPNLIERAITKRTKAIVPVHWAGKIANMTPIMEIASKYNIPIIEDAAQTMGSFYRNKHGGTFGLSGANSCHPLKNLNALGDGGLLLTNNDEVAKKAKRYRNHGLEGRDNCVEYGINSRLDVLNAEVLSFRLKKLDQVTEKRAHNLNLYRELINKNNVILPVENNYQLTSYVMCLALFEKRDELQKFLFSNGIESLIYYGTPLHLHKAANIFGYNRGDFPIAEKQSNMVLALPHHQYLEHDQINYVADKVNEFFRK